MKPLAEEGRAELMARSRMESKVKPSQLSVMVTLANSMHIHVYIRVFLFHKSIGKRSKVVLFSPKVMFLLPHDLKFAPTYSLKQTLTNFPKLYIVT